MTYCLGLMLEDGIVLASDSRTSAGVDYATVYSKMHAIQPAPDRQFVILSAGNLALTQEIISHIHRDLDHTPENSLAAADYMFEAADYLGKLSLRIQKEHGKALKESGVSSEVTLLLAGSIAGQPHGLMMIYPQGNAISATEDTPYLQIGETKYGKPVLDRVVDYDMPLERACQLALVSLDSTSRSNISVGPPYELAILSDKPQLRLQRFKYSAEDAYMQEIKDSWNTGIRQAFDHLPEFKLGEAIKNTSDTVVSLNPNNSNQGL